jgi:hypothetical protein
MKKKIKESCPSCDSETGLREILYGMLDSDFDESKYAIGGCIVSPNAPIWACVECGWKGWSLNNSYGIKLSKMKCIVCESTGKIELLNLDREANRRFRNRTYKAEMTYGEQLPNAMCVQCGWTLFLVQTYSY